MNKDSKLKSGSGWVAQSVKHPTSAQVMISRLMNSSPASSSVRTAQSLEPASDSVSPSLSALLMLCLSKRSVKNVLRQKETEREKERVR